MGAKRSTGEVTHVSLSKREFLALIDEGKVGGRPARLADWPQIFSDCKEGQGQEPFSARQFWEIYVQGAVSRQRSRNKLEELHVQGRLLRVEHPVTGAYYYMWPEKELQ